MLPSTIIVVLVVRGCMLHLICAIWLGNTRTLRWFDYSSGRPIVLMVGLCRAAESIGEIRTSALILSHLNWHRVFRDLSLEGRRDSPLCHHLIIQLNPMAFLRNILVQIDWCGGLVMLCRPWLLLVYLWKVVLDVVCHVVCCMLNSRRLWNWTRVMDLGVVLLMISEIELVQLIAAIIIGNIMTWMRGIRRSDCAPGPEPLCHIRVLSKLDLRVTAISASWSLLLSFLQNLLKSAHMMAVAVVDNGTFIAFSRLSNWLHR
jgi:hypothetical protein